MIDYFKSVNSSTIILEELDKNYDPRIEPLKEYAKEMHNTADNGKPQMRWGKLNYFENHPLKIYEQIRDAGYPFEYQAAGLCHDLLEDTKADPKKIEELAGPKVLEAVKLLTKKDDQSEKDYLDNIAKNDIAKVVKACDRLNNMKSLLTDAPKDMALAYLAKKHIKETKDFYKNYKFKGIDIIGELDKIEKGLGKE